MRANGLTAESGCARALMRTVSNKLPYRTLAHGAAIAVIGLSTGCSRVSPDRQQTSFRPPQLTLRSATGPVDLSSASPSPHLSADGPQIPKGGGAYKLGSPYKIAGRWYVPAEDPNYDRSGIASWYGADFHGRKTANGEIFDMHALTAAHPTLPIPSYVYVTSLKTGRTVLVRINDRGPYAHDRIMDLSRRTAEVLGVAGAGVSEVRVRYAGRAPLNGDDSHERRYLASQSWAGSIAGAQPQFPRRMGLLRQE